MKLEKKSKILNNIILKYLINMQKISSWNIDKLAAQIIFPRLDIETFQNDLTYQKKIITLVEKGIGGFCIFNGNCEQTEKTINYLQSIAEIPIIFTADFENGLPMRLEDGTAFPHAMALGIADDEKLTEEISTAIAKEAKDIGVHWNLAPVCDINSNPLNPIINIRAFGNNPENVFKQVKAYITGHIKEKILTTAKHFPGHGDTITDSHIEIPIINKDLAQIENNELKPFISAIEAGVHSIMVGHLLLRCLDDELPASLSGKIVKGYIRNRLNYNGLVLTDALDMQSVAKKYDFSTLISNALLAGNDILLMPEHPEQAVEIVVEMISSSKDVHQQVIKSVERIYSLKRACGLIPYYAKSNHTINTWMKHSNLALRAAIKSIISHIPENELPIDSHKQYAAFSIIQNDYDIQAASRFFTLLAQATENDCDYAYLDGNISDDEIIKIKDNITEAKYVIFAIFSKGRAYQGSIQLSEKIIDIIEKISNGRKNYIVVFGYPYFSKQLPFTNIIYGFSDSFPTIAAAIMKLTGRELPDYF